MQDSQVKDFITYRAMRNTNSLVSPHTGWMLPWKQQSLKVEKELATSKTEGIREAAQQGEEQDEAIS